MQSPLAVGPFVQTYGIAAVEVQVHIATIVRYTTRIAFTLSNAPAFIRDLAEWR